MSFIQRQVAHCDVCGHEWLTAKVPSHCAKCKSRKWNTVPAPDVMSREDMTRLLAQLQHKVAHPNTAGKHNPKTCRIYKCGMCAAAKG